MKKLSTFIGAAALLASGSASAIVVGGVDFGVAGQFNHIETTTLAETFINAPGQTLMGYGQVNTVNGNSNYAGGDLLYFVFDYNVATFSPTAANFNGGSATFYLGNLGNLLSQDSATNVANITSLGLWADFNGVSDASGYELQANGQLTGSSLSFTGAGLLEVAGGLADVVNFLDSDGIPNGVGGFADALVTTSANNLVLNGFDNTAGCQDGSATAGQWCLAGSADVRGQTNVPEPSTIALLGLGLLSFGASAIRKKKSA
jgi:hypothetical protein